MAEKKARYKGLITLTPDNAEPEAPVTRAGVDLTPFRETILKSATLKGMVQTAEGAWAVDPKAQRSPTPALGFTIDLDAVSLYESRFRSAATQLGVGLNIDVVKFGDSRGVQYGLTEGKARIKVEAREKKAFPGTAAKPAANGAAPAKAAGLPKPAGRK